jgi:hypothetical protein
MSGHNSPRGVWIEDDYRSNLIIDRYDPIFAEMRGKKLDHLRSINSEDAITWNVFRSLRQIDPEMWLPKLWESAFDVPLPEDLNFSLTLWKSIPPPPELPATEGPSEIDVVIETDSWVWFIEAKYRSDISMRTTNDSTRDQIIRNLDVGSYYAGSNRHFYFSLLTLNDQTSPCGIKKLKKYRDDDFNLVRQRLMHRADGLKNLHKIGRLTWSQLAEILNALMDVKNPAARLDEQPYASRALEWLKSRIKEAP